MDKPVPAIATASLILPGGIPLELCRVPAGTFWMGSREVSNARPRHPVRIQEDFWLGQVPVTLAQFRVFVERTGRKWNTTRVTAADQPVVGVSWNDALAFCDWLNTCRSSSTGSASVDCPAELGDSVATLPTEAEWERACRGAAGDSCVEHDFGCGDGAEALAAVAWFGLDWEAEVPRVRQKRPTDWGLHDLHGLVWEWCHDEYAAEAYAKRGVTTVDAGALARLDAPKEVADNARRVLRGGSWDNSAAGCRSAIRSGDRAVDRYGIIGFRVAVVPGPSRAQRVADRAQAQPGLGHAARRQAVAEWERRGGAGSAAEPDEFGAGVVPPECPDGPPTSGP